MRSSKALPSCGSSVKSSMIVSDPHPTLFWHVRPNAHAHREPPRRVLSVSPEPQQGGDAVERTVSRLG